MSTEAMKLALEALIAEYYMENSSFAKRVDDIFKEALAQPQQEPVAYFETITGRIAVRDDTHRRKFPMCYRPLVFGDTSPPARKPLTDEELEVSIDVSTGDHDSGNRLFGSVTLVQENQGSKHGLILLVQDPEANFKTAAPKPAPVQQPPVAAVAWQQGYDQGVADERISEANIGIAGFGAKVNPARNNPYTSPPAQQEFVCSTGLCHYRKPLTDEEIETVWRSVQANDFHDCVKPFARAVEAAHGIEENT